MTAEMVTETYTDEDLAEYIESYPVEDKMGEAPLYVDGDGELTTNPDWTPTYDMNAAAADIWVEKAAVLAQDYDYSADGANYSRNQPYEQAMKQARYYRSRRAVGTITQRPEPLAQGEEETEDV